jgi:hypothetical protein
MKPRKKEATEQWLLIKADDNSARLDSDANILDEYVPTPARGSPPTSIRRSRPNEAPQAPGD